MEFSSSEDNELVEDFIDVEDDTGTTDVDPGTAVMASQTHCVDHSEESMLTAGNELLVAADELVKNGEPFLGMEFDSDELRVNSTVRMRYALGSAFVLPDPAGSGEKVLRYLS